MARFAAVPETLAILLGMALSIALSTSVLVPACGPPRGSVFLTPPLDDVSETIIRFESVEPSNQAVLAGAGSTWQQVEAGSMLVVQGTELDLQLRAPGSDGPLKVAFEIVREEASVSRAEFIAQRPTITLSGDFVRVQEWGRGRPRQLSRRIEVEYHLRAVAAEVLAATRLFRELCDYMIDVIPRKVAPHESGRSA